MRTLRKTLQRQAIQNAIERACRPLSPREIFDLSLAEAPGLGIATVYRTIRQGTASGWLAPVELPGEPPRYEVAGKPHHHHFHCRACGGVYEVIGCPENIQSLTPSGFSLEGHEVVLYGRCRSCA